MKMMLAYILWHWPKEKINRLTYETHLIAFHQSLLDDPPEGYLGSIILRSHSLPWVETRGEVYQDWYLIEGFGALEGLNAGAVSGSRKNPHDEIALEVEGSKAGLYRFLKGSPYFKNPENAYWFSKPRGVTVKEFTQPFDPLLNQGQKNLWQRQMGLGPAPEYCLLSSPKVKVPLDLEPFEISVVKIWGKVRSDVHL